MPGNRKQPCVYILASGRNGTLYVGVTSNPVKRIWEHKNDLVPGFSEKYAAHALVWFEMPASMIAAITREKTIKKWKRKWKLQMIEESNPYWRDLYDDIV
jgi:putative endonuclease